MKDIKKVQFDPGYAPLVIDSIGQVGYTYYMFSASNNLRLKKINFPIVFKKIEKFLKKNIAFYIGCLLWACYISNIENCEIEGNKLLGEETTEEEYTSEISFLIDLVEKVLSRDCKYFIGKPYVADERFLTILKAYKEFLIINQGFVNCSNTSQIKLPESINKPDESKLKEIYEKIQEAINEKNIENLLECYNLIFD